MRILTISEMIEQLEAIKEKEGDIAIVTEYQYGNYKPYMAVEDMTVKTLETHEIAYNNSSIYGPLPPNQLRCVVLL